MDDSMSIEEEDFNNVCVCKLTLDFSILYDQIQIYIIMGAIIVMINSKITIIMTFKSFSLPTEITLHT